MKKMLYGFAVLVLMAPVAALAQFGSTGGDDYEAIGDKAGMTNLSFGDIVTNIMNWLLGILGLGAIISFVIAGIMYLTAAGDEGKTEKAKGMMTYAIIAVVVALIGFIAVRLVTNLLGADTGDVGTNI